MDKRGGKLLSVLLALKKPRHGFGQVLALAPRPKPRPKRKVAAHTIRFGRFGLQVAAVFGGKLPDVM